MDFKQTTIKQPQTHQLNLKFEISGLADCHECEQLVESYADVLRSQIQLGNPQLQISYSIGVSDCPPSKSHSTVQLPQF
ncbi:MAG: hypothetical protein N4J56_006488 [Chroococcidiopsis sp. SAG 2025]|uniref:hypothetical protein n=1 Tax=Chroococcidiopsis sp. SAG 2025 TaxID=171389 RepID=UPI0029373DF7|nr:hypothetical protein [Chroococcidiopsis sp. SAG 2025]MDV2996783.1 hypothetical protein [Chroococcidiopsis sp. SAG 2025]